MRMGHIGHPEDRSNQRRSGATRRHKCDHRICLFDIMSRSQRECRQTCTDARLGKGMRRNCSSSCRHNITRAGLTQPEAREDTYLPMILEMLKSGTVRNRTNKWRRARVEVPNTLPRLRATIRSIGSAWTK